jgi:hypothetical protein
VASAAEMATTTKMATAATVSAASMTAATMRHRSCWQTNSGHGKNQQTRCQFSDHDCTSISIGTSRAHFQLRCDYTHPSPRQVKGLHLPVDKVRFA